MTKRTTGCLSRKRRICGADAGISGLTPAFNRAYNGGNRQRGRRKNNGNPTGPWQLARLVHTVPGRRLALRAEIRRLQDPAYVEGSPGSSPATAMTSRSVFGRRRRWTVGRPEEQWFWTEKWQSRTKRKTVFRRCELFENPGEQNPTYITRSARLRALDFRDA